MNRKPVLVILALVFGLALGFSGNTNPVSDVSNPSAVEIPASPTAPLIVEVPVPPIPQGETDTPPPFGTVVQQWNLSMRASNSGAGITWVRDSGKFYLLDRYPSNPTAWSFDPNDPEGTLTDMNWTFPVPYPACTRPWGLVYDPDSGCFWVAQHGGSSGGVDYLLRFENGQWCGTPPDSWKTHQAFSMQWMGGMVKWTDLGFFYGVPIGGSGGDNIAEFDPYTKSYMGRVQHGASVSERGCSFIPYDSLYLLTTGWNNSKHRKRDTTGLLLQEASATVYGPADMAVWVPQVINPDDTVFIYCMNNNSSNTLQKLSSGMTWGQLPSVNPYNVAMNAILSPVGAVDSGAVVVPTVVVRNKGNEPVDRFDVFIQIEDETDGIVYSDHDFVLDLGPGAFDTLEFTSTEFERRDSLLVTAWTFWPPDESPGDDTLSHKFLVRVKDVAVTDILAPIGTLDSGVVVWPECRVWNYGNETQTFDVEFRIGAYQNTVSVNNLIPGGARAITASESLITRSGAWIHRVEAILAGDLHPDNNVMYDTFYVLGTPEHDVAAEEILAPTGYISPTERVTPSARVANWGGQPETFQTFFSVWDTVTDELVYREALQVNLGGGGNTTVNYPDTVFKVLGMHTTQCSVYLAGDQNVLNDVVEGDFEVIATEHNVLVEQITSPTGAIDSGSVVTPSCDVRNTGTFTENFGVYFTIESGYRGEYYVTNLAPGSTRTVEFDDWPVDVGRDSLTATAWTWLIGDERREDDTLSVEFFVQVRDVGVEEVIAPVDTLAEGIWVHPECRVRNYGSTVETFDVEFRIGLWLGSTTVTDLEPGDAATVVMVESLQTQVGIWLDQAATLLAGDANPGNNAALDTFWVLGTITHDVGVAAILAPTGTIDTLTTVTPKARVANYGEQTETWWTYFRVLDPTGGEAYSEALETTLPPTGEVVLEFPDVRFTVPGVYVSRCSTWLDTDQNWTNNLAIEEFEVGDPTIWEPGWREMKPMPTQPSGKPVKRGGWLTIDTEGTIYAGKGYKTGDFYSYDPILNRWTQRASIPWQHHPNPKWARKAPRKGAKGVCDGNNYIYMTQGNNTLGFWRYDIPGDSWDVLSDVPFGKFRKKVKGGTDLVYVTPSSDQDTAFVYLLKGYKTEFYRYTVESPKWDTLAEAPTGKRAKWDKGAWIVASPSGGPTPDRPLYAHKAKYHDGTYHEMWKYNIAGDSWSDKKLKGMPLMGLHSGRIRKKKSKDGGCGAWHISEIYALKGGNTQQFWKYMVARDTWKEMDTIPTYGTTGRRKRVKYGADIVSYGYGAFFALKGNKTSEFWRYVLPHECASRPERDGVTAGGKRLAVSGVRISPNPLAGGFATLRYSLPKVGPAYISIFDVVGRTQSRQTVLAGRTGAVSLDLRSLSTGVYLVRFDADGFTATRKLVVQH